MAEKYLGHFGRNMRRAKVNRLAMLGQRCRSFPGKRFQPREPELSGKLGKDFSDIS